MQHEKYIATALPVGQTGMTQQSYQCETGSDCLGEAAEDIIAKIEQSGRFTAQSCENAYVVLAEVLNNIAEHSYGGQPGGQIQMNLSYDDNGINVETLDFGVPMPGLAVPLPNLPNNDVAQEELPEGGFGWYLIHTLAPAPEYCRRGNTNILRFTIK